MKEILKYAAGLAVGVVSTVLFPKIKSKLKKEKKAESEKAE